MKSSTCRLENEGNEGEHLWSTLRWGRGQRTKALALQSSGARNGERRIQQRRQKKQVSCEQNQDAGASQKPRKERISGRREWSTMSWAAEIALAPKESAGASVTHDE